MSDPGSHAHSGNGDLEAVYDALHGDIDLEDLDASTEAPIRNIISAPFLQRLRRIKQLGFVSQTFLSAQHNRYAHALGTMHIAKRLIARVELKGVVLANSLGAINALAGDDSFNSSDPPSAKRATDRLKQHLLVAALIQDVGELPFERATAKLFTPGEEIRGTVGDARIDISQLSSKHLFTLFYIWDGKTSERYFKGLSRQVLTFLITGIVPSGQSAPELRALRQIVDGAIDADRLDYVYRDALHTMGVHHSAEGLIAAITDYDEFGPTLSHPRPAADFMITRATLWSNVYLSPENRFRLILLRNVLGQLKTRKALAEKHLGWRLGDISHEQFEVLHDPAIDNLVRALHNDTSSGLPKESRDALRLLEEGAADYEHRWVPAGSGAHPEWKGPISLPSSFYFDTYADYDDHSLYATQSVRIVGDRFNLAQTPLYLEQCSGPFSRLLAENDWSALPMPGHTSWFLPRNAPRDGLWGPLFKFAGAPELAEQLRLRDQMQGVDFLFDTRRELGFRPPAIFISFATEDSELADRVAGILSEDKRQYFILRGPDQGIGQSPLLNSERCVNEAEAVLILLSHNYVRIYAAEPNGPLAAEVHRMTARRDDIPIVPLTLDPYEEVNKNLPFSTLTSEGRQPFVGGALRPANGVSFRQIVLSALAYIDLHKRIKP